MNATNLANLPYRPCVGIMLIDRRGFVFAGERLDTPGAWQMPQGGIDKGEDPLTAALRELEEEIGLRRDLVDVVAEHPEWVRYDLPSHLVGTLWKGKFRGQEQKWFLLKLLGVDDDIDIQTSDPEFAAWRWIDPDDLINHIVPFKRSVYEQVVAGLKPHFPSARD